MVGRPKTPADAGWIESLAPLRVTLERLADAVKLAATRAGRREMTGSDAWNRAGLLLIRYSGETIRDLEHPRERALVTDSVALLRHLTDFDRHHLGVCTGGDRLSFLAFGDSQYPGPASASVGRFFGEIRANRDEGVDMVSDIR